MKTKSIGPHQKIEKISVLRPLRFVNLRSVAERSPARLLLAKSGKRLGAAGNVMHSPPPHLSSRGFLVSVSRLTALAEAAIAALENGDYATAIRSALAIKPLLAATPDMSRSSAGDSQSMSFRNAEAIDSFVKECRQLQNQAAAQSSGGPFAQSLVRYQRATE